MKPRSPARLLFVFVAAAVAVFLLQARALEAGDLTVDASNGNSPYTVNSDAGYGNVTVGETGTGVLDQTSGTLLINNELDVADQTTSNGIYNLSSGTVSPTAEIIGNYGTGTFTQTGGNNDAGSSLSIGYNAGSSGTYNLNSFNGTATLGSLNSSGYANTEETIGYCGNGTFNQSGGTNTAADITIGYTAHSTGTYNLSGGTISVGSTLNVGYNGTGAFVGSGTFNQTGGTITHTPRT
ncbi:MAG: hypothetical protein JO354_04805 [Verrucomicrobia bacterium]|nr:hypothetical protein [Verrucomicrobiota bacterium]